MSIPRKRKDVKTGYKVFKKRQIFTIKRDGIYKVRQVIRGFELIKKIDYQEIFIIIVRAEFYRILLAIITFLDWDIKQIDVDTVFLYNDIDCEIYIKLPDIAGVIRKATLCMREISTLPPCYQGCTEASLSKKCRNYLPKPRFLIYPIQISSNMRVASCLSHLLLSAFFFIALSTSPVSKPQALVRIL